LLISLFVPKAKPLHNFEIEDETLTYLSELLQTKDCVVYVFGNPYALQVIPNLALAKEIVMVYQDFEVFQEAAAQQLIQKLACKGKLPVSIKSL
jgi:beta-N-acetylhexosaminidase